MPTARIDGQQTTIFAPAVGESGWLLVVDRRGPVPAIQLQRAKRTEPTHGGVALVPLSAPMTLPAGEAREWLEAAGILAAAFRAAQESGP